MTATYEHPSLRMYVNEAQRDRAEAWLKEAYADGRVTELEFDRRIGQVLSAVTRKDLNEAFYGLVQVPTPSRALGVHPAYQPLVRPETRQQVGRGAAGFAHFSAIFTWLIGPGLVYALSTPGTYARREAAKAFNFQLIALIAFIGTAMVSGISDQEWLMGVGFVSWLVLTVLGGAKALQGDNWRNPVTKVVRLQALSEK